MRSLILATLLAFSILRPALAVSFINPAPPSGTTGDFGANPVYTEGSAIQVAWTDTQDNGIPFSVVVLQVDSSKGTEIPSGQAFEYVVHNSVNLTSSNWVVATAKDLAFSNVFVLDIFFQGDTAGRALSHWFNISKSTDETQQPTQTVGVITVSVTSAATASSTAASTPVAANDSSFGTGAKIGLAVGIVGILVLGVVVGWFWSRRNRSGRGRGQPELAMGGTAAGLGVGVGREAAVPEKAFYEVHGKTSPRELNGEATRYELYGTYP